MFYIEEITIFVRLSQLTPQLFQRPIQMYYEFESRILGQKSYPSSVDGYYIRRIINYTKYNKARPIQQVVPIRSELEILQYGYIGLIRTFYSNTIAILLPLINFVNSFSLYRNIYRLLIGFYIILIGLLFYERTRRTNVLALILSPYSSNIEAVVRTISLLLRQLDNGQLLNIPRRDELVLVCTYIVFYIGDILQQQENSGIKSQNTNRGYCSCLISRDKYSNLRYNLISNSRFYYENERTRAFINSLTTQKKRDNFSITTSIDVRVVLLQLISPVLDIIVIRLTDSIYSKYGSISNLLYKLLLKAILKLVVQTKYAQVLRSFPFLLGQARLQSPLNYLGSYSLSKHARQSIIIPVLLRIQLRDKYIKDYFRNNIKVYILVLLRVLIVLIGLLEATIIVLTIVTRIFSLVARSNVNLISNTLSSRDRDQFVDKMIAIRILFQQINKVVVVASIKNLQSRIVTPVQLRRALVLASTLIPIFRQASTSIPIPSFAISII